MKTEKVTNQIHTKRSEHLHQRWYALLTQFTQDDQLIHQLWMELEAAYSASDRYYHNLQHLAFMFELFDRYADQIQDTSTFQFAVFYHDVVYDPDRKDNEEQSAEIAVLRLKEVGVPEDIVMRCAEQIRATKSHQPVNDPDGNFLLDIDLAILATNEGEYQRYTQNVRKEYMMIKEHVYRAGRKEVLSRFLEREQIYHTEAFYEVFEKAARRNLRNELSTLA